MHNPTGLEITLLMYGLQISNMDGIKTLTVMMPNKKHLSKGDGKERWQFYTGG